ncbi:Myb DNA-bind 3 domain-containing protein [Abeliophyllum distichum]|uniref:Myb DNA-bind 3 domain-containing protein n=1 Tax=Abeliophyllum distichum TaxID=126358 RepID=A0ABD1S964_9LAMI
MAHLRNNTAAPFHVPRPTTAANMDDNDTNRTQVDPSTKIRQVRWNDDMDGLMIVALVNEVLAGHKRSDNGFTVFQILKVIESVKNGCGIVVSDKNVRARLKTLKREYAEVSQLLSISGFGWDAETGQITVDSIAWDDLVKLITEKLEAMDLHLVDIMKAFRSDGDLAKVFMSLTNTTIMRALVYEQLGRDPPPLP